MCGQARGGSTSLKTSKFCSSFQSASVAKSISFYSSSNSALDNLLISAIGIMRASVDDNKDVII